MKQRRQFRKGALLHRGARVTTLDGLSYLASEKRAVFCPGSAGAWIMPRPAAWVIQLPGAMLLNMMSCGMYVYEKKGGANG